MKKKKEIYFTFSEDLFPGYHTEDKCGRSRFDWQSLSNLKKRELLRTITTFSTNTSLLFRWSVLLHIKMNTIFKAYKVTSGVDTVTVDGETFIIHGMMYIKITKRRIKAW